MARLDHLHAHWHTVCSVNVWKLLNECSVFLTVLNTTELSKLCVVSSSPWTWPNLYCMFIVHGAEWLSLGLRHKKKSLRDVGINLEVSLLQTAVREAVLLLHLRFSSSLWKMCWPGNPLACCRKYSNPPFFFTSLRRLNFSLFCFHTLLLKVYCIKMILNTPV